MIQSMQRIALIALSLAVAAVAAGCGGAAGGVTKARALAYAHAVNLQPSDLPGWSPGGRELVVNDSGLERELAKCMGIPSPHERVSLLSRDLRNGDQGADSRVTVRLGKLPTGNDLAAKAARNLAAIGSERGRACNVRSMRQLYAHYTRPGRRAIVSVTSLPNPLSGTDGSVALRFHVVGTVTFTLEVGGSAVEREIGPGSRPTHRRSWEESRLRRVPIRFYEDLVVLDLPNDAASVELYAANRSQPFAAQTERHLIELLYSRAKAHKL